MSLVIIAFAPGHTHGHAICWESVKYWNLLEPRGAPKFSKNWLGIAHSLYDAGHIKPYFVYLDTSLNLLLLIGANSCTTFPGTNINTCDQKILTYHSISILLLNILNFFLLI